VGIDWDSQTVVNYSKLENEKNRKEVVYRLAELQVNLNHRRTPIEILYDWVLQSKKIQDDGQPLKTNCDWSRCRI